MPYPSMWAPSPKNPYLTNFAHPVVQEEYKKFCEANGLSAAHPLSDAERMMFDVSLVDKYGIDSTMPEYVRFRYAEYTRFRQTKKEAVPTVQK